MGEVITIPLDVDKMLQWLIRYAPDTINLNYLVVDVLYHKMENLREKVETSEFTEAEMLKELKFINTMVNEVFVDKNIDPLNIV